jgi:hypothetical protein
LALAKRLERKARFAAFYAANAPKFRIGVELQMGFGTGSSLSAFARTVREARGFLLRLSSHDFFLFLCPHLSALSVMSVVENSCALVLAAGP